MITEKLARSQIEALLLSLQPSLRKQKAAQASIIKVESGEIMDCIERSVKSLKELFDSEARKMILDFAKDVGFGFEALFRAQLAFLQSPESGFDVDRAETVYAGIKASFQEKYFGFFAAEYDKPDDVFLSMKENLDEIRSESRRLVEQLSKPAATVQQTQSEPKPQKPEETKPKQPETANDKKTSSSFFSSIKSVFNKLKPAKDGFIKTDLGKDSSGMKWDPVKKKWCFDDNEEEEPEEVKKLPPKKKDLEKKKEEEAKKEDVPPEKSITDSLIKPRGKTAADRAKARKAGEKAAPKVAKLSANAFAEINSQAATFTFEQQRELIIFELRELVSSSLNQMKPTLPETDSQEELGLFEADLRTYRQRLAQFVESALQRAYSHTRDALRDARASQKSQPSRLSRATQTDQVCDEEKREQAAQVETLQEKLGSLEAFHRRETQALARQALSFKQLAGRMAEAALREHQTALQLTQLAQEDQQAFSDDELQQLLQLFAGLRDACLASANSASRSSRLRSCLDLLLQANENKGQFILALQKKYHENQVKIYEMTKQREVVLKEKELLKGVSRSFLAESLHYQSECDRLHLACLKSQKAHAALLKVHDAHVDFCNRLLACFRQRAAADQQAYEQIFSELQNVCSLEKQKNTAANLRVESLIRLKVDGLKKDVIKLQTGLDSWQNQCEIVNQERIDLVKQLVDSDSKYSETLNHAQAALSRELEVQKKFEDSELQRKKLEEEVARLKNSKSSLQSLADKLQERLKAAEDQADQLKTHASQKDSLLEQLEAANAKAADLALQVQSLGDALAAEAGQSAETKQALDRVQRDLQESAAKAECEGLQLLAVQAEAEGRASELQSAQEALAEHAATVKLYEQLWTEAWDFIQNHADYPPEAQTTSLCEAVELLCNCIGAKASALQTQLDQQLQECEDLKLHQSQASQASAQTSSLVAEEALKKLASTQLDFEKRLEQAGLKHAEELLALQKMVDDLETKQNEAEKLIADKSDELEKLQAATRSQLESAQRTAVQLSDLIQEKESLELSLKQSQNTILDLQETGSQLAKSLKEQIAAASTGDEAMSHTIASQQSQLEAKDAVLEELRRRLHEEEHRALGLASELAQRERGLEASQEAEAAYKEELAELARKLALATQALQQLEDRPKQPSPADLQQQLEEHEKRISLLQMDLLEAKKAAEDYRLEIEELRSKLFSELRVSASAGSRDASELLEMFFQSK